MLGWQIFGFLILGFLIFGFLILGFLISGFLILRFLMLGWQIFGFLILGFLIFGFLILGFLMLGWQIFGFLIFGFLMFGFLVFGLIILGRWMLRLLVFRLLVFGFLVLRWQISRLLILWLRIIKSFGKSRRVNVRFQIILYRCSVSAFFGGRCVRFVALVDVFVGFCCFIGSGRVSCGRFVTLGAGGFSVSCHRLPHVRLVRLRG